MSSENIQELKQTIADLQSLVVQQYDFELRLRQEIEAIASDCEKWSSADSGIEQTAYTYQQLMKQLVLRLNALATTLEKA